VFTEQASAKDLYRDTSVPVFATLKGVLTVTSLLYIKMVHPRLRIIGQDLLQNISSIWPILCGCKAEPTIKHLQTNTKTREANEKSLQEFG